MLRNIRLILCLTLSFIVTCFLLIVIHRKIKVINAAFKEEVSLKNELQTYKNLKKLLETQNASKALQNVGAAVILKQSLINAIETANASYVFPIPQREKRQIVIFSSWRSGSTFLGDIFNTVPGTYYHYEPFNYRGVHQLQTNEHTIEYVKNLLKCQYQFTKEHMRYSVHWFFNKRLAQYCSWKGHVKFCEHVAFRSDFCNIFPRQSMKLVRTRFTLAEHLLSDPDFNLNVVLLVRDPRAVHLSREDLPKCKYDLDCHSMKRYCDFLVEDYKTAQILREKYATRIKVVRFEDLATSPSDVTKEIFDQFGMVFDERIQIFLEEHTKSRRHGTHSTSRDSRYIVARWMRTLNMKVVTNIQNECKEAMELWGYRPIQHIKQLNSTVFDPLDVFK